ncbi:MAG: type II toxin-antitoxin system CcdA family antitoxin [Candidatus Bathyarchaeota archaeon]|nr:MAG: type II toxin-antitoxin system CcdA family antitoxin [Candidatus Bathyarchaeota archaeon]
MATKVNTCIYLDRKVLETAKRVGLNVSRVSENALVEAIGRLRGMEAETGLKSRPRVEGRGRDSNPGGRLHRPVDYQATCSIHTFFCEVFLKSLSTLY